MSSKMGEAELNRMVAVDILPDRITSGWRPARGEPFPTPHTDEAVVFEDYFWRGLGFPIHPFLRDLLEFWAISLCNLHPNTILHVVILSISVRRFWVFFHTSTSSGTCSG